jgi:hypothetical protein
MAERLEPCGQRGVIQDGAVKERDLGDNSVGSAKVIDDSLVGADIQEDTLAEVPSATTAGTATNADNASLLDGRDSTEFVDGGGTIHRAADSALSPGSTLTLTTGLATISYACPNNLASNGTITFTNNNGGLAPVWTDDGASVGFNRVGVAPLNIGAAAGGDHVTIGSQHQQQPNRTVDADVFSVHDQGFQVCSVLIQAIVN